MLRVQCGRGYTTERLYAIQTLLTDRLGLEFTLEQSDQDYYHIRTEDGRMLVLPDVFFRIPQRDWLAKSTLPTIPTIGLDLRNLPLDVVLCESTLPVLYAAPEHGNPGISITDERIQLDVDVFGAAFFMLSRYEEAVSAKRDEHGRFPARESVTFNGDLFERPIIDEYTELLWACLHSLWPRLRRRDRTFRVMFSHDIDRPFRFVSLPKVLKGSLRDARHGNLPGAWRWIRDGTRNSRHPPRDPFFAGVFDIFSTLESNGVRGVFNYMAAPVGLHDFGYDPGRSPIREVIARTVERGHEVGFHPGYHTHGSPSEFTAQLQRLQRATPATIHGGRQHYLRFSVSDTWATWDAAGLEYDSTLGWPEISGFRAGTCIPFSVFDLQARRRLNLVERPLIVMDSALRDTNGVYLTVCAAREKIHRLADRCALMRGEFVLLWHNSSFWGEWEERGSLYPETVEYLASRIA